MTSLTSWLLLNVSTENIEATITITFRNNICIKLASIFPANMRVRETGFVNKNSVVRSRSSLAIEFGGEINDRGEIVRFFVPHTFQEAMELVSDAAASAGFGIFYAAKGPFGATAPNQFLMERPVDGMIVQVSFAGTPSKPRILIRKE
jgi:hypothetical protein